MTERDDFGERLRNADDCVARTVALIERLREEIPMDHEILMRSIESLEHSRLKLDSHRDNAH